MDANDFQAALAAARLGDAAALGALLTAFRPFVRVVVRAARRRPASARIDDSDLVQDTLLEVSKAFASFRGESRPQWLAWLRQVASRAARRTLRGQEQTEKRDPMHERDLGDFDFAEQATPPERVVMRRELADRLARLVDDLPEDMRRVVLARHLDERSHQEIADELGRSAGAVRMLYLRALQRLRDGLGE